MTKAEVRQARAVAIALIADVDRMLDSGLVVTARDVLAQLRVVVDEMFGQVEAATPEGSPS